MWKIINKYVKDFFDQNQAGIQEYWSEIAAMSKDLTAHSILKPELGILDIKTLQDLREMCVYVIYISTFQHSWVNHKQYDDGGDIEYATLGMWKEKDPMTAAKNARQLTTTLNLTSVRHNPIMGVNLPVANKLKEALWEIRDQIQPGIAIDTILMSISI
jgi:linolenate 9R-lipoxygenase